MGGKHSAPDPDEFSDEKLDKLWEEMVQEADEDPEDS